MDVFDKSLDALMLSKKETTAWFPTPRLQETVLNISKSAWLNSEK